MSTELYLIHTGFLREQEVFERKLRMVSAERKKRVEACRAMEDKLRSLAGGLLLEELLRQNFYSPQKLVRDDNGKLRIAEEEDFFFNLSHSGDYAACVISTHPVGVDIQQYRPVKHGVAKRFFQPQEARHIEKNRGDDENLFFRYWTGKESYSKLTGEGLAQSFNSLAVNLEKGIVEDKRRPETISFLKEYFCLPDYAITVASHKNDFFRFVKKIIYRM